MLPTLDELDRYDSLYVSPHADDAALSSAGGIVEERSRGLRVLVLTLFETPATPERQTGRPTARLGVDQIAAALPAAADRSPEHLFFRSVLGSWLPEDEEALREAARVVAEVLRRTRPRHVYVPLAVWPHVDHRVAHLAARRVLEPGADRDVFFYEERPYSLVPSAVRIRLAEIGARLPPAAVVTADDAGLARFVLRFSLDPFVRRHFRGFRDRARSTALASRGWRRSRDWRPLRAFGPRLQPAIHPVPATALDVLAGSASAFEKGPPFGPTERYLASLRRHARRLGQSAPVERYWLLLPDRPDGRAEAPPADEAAP